MSWESGKKLSVIRYCSLLLSVVVPILSFSCHQSYPKKPDVNQSQNPAGVTVIPNKPVLEMTPELQIKSFYDRTCMGSVKSDGLSGREMAHIDVIDNQRSFEEAINKDIGTPAAVPPVDFSKEIVVMASAGEQADCGKKILFFKSNKKVNKQKVVFVVTGQCPYGDVNETSTVPIAFIKLPRLGDADRYYFSREEVTGPEVCQFTSRKDVF